MKIKSIKGFHDILPENTAKYQYVEKVTKKIFENFGFREIRLPVMEYTDVFTTGLGNTTDIVEKEMYTFEDRDGSSITLRPEGTAGVVRSFIENSMHLKSPVNKLYYTGTMFRHERPQKGRYRGFNQIGAEIFGSDSPHCDCDLISMLWNTMEELELTDYLELEINSIGFPDDRRIFKNKILDFFTPEKENLCEDCKRKLQSNPLRIFDCKNKICRQIASDAPSILDFLSDESKKHFEEIQYLLTNLNIPFKINNRIVRGLDYYTNTVFELTTSKLGSQNAVAAGGRYDMLVEQFGGVKTPAIGFAIGLERLVLLYEPLDKVNPDKIDIFIACVGKEARDEALKAANFLRKQDLIVELNYDDKSFKSQLKRANKLNASFSILIGESELEKNTVILRNMTQSKEINLPLKHLDKFKEYSSRFN